MLHRSSPFDGVPDLANDLFVVQEHQDCWLVSCRRCSAGWFIPRSHSDPSQIVRPLWHAFEEHHLPQ